LIIYHERVAAKANRKLDVPSAVRVSVEERPKPIGVTFRGADFDGVTP